MAIPIASTTYNNIKNGIIMRVKNEVAIVTGSAQGLGRTYALALSRDGRMNAEVTVSR